MKRIAVLMTCHNRAETTLACLGTLFAAMGQAENLGCRVFLVDDGSTDGTSERVRAAFPQIKIVSGDGTLYWAKGMALAWETAVAEGDWDAYLWLNDDTRLNNGALAEIETADDGESIVVGNLQDVSGKVVYGMCDDGLFTGNCVFVPKVVFDHLGMICGEYAHAWADSDYARQARRLGVRIICAGIVGTAEGHPNRPSLKGISLCERMRMLRDPKGWNVHDLWLYRRRNWGVCRAVVSCLHLIMHVLKGER